MPKLRKKEFPLEITDLDPVITEELKKYSKGPATDYVQIGPKKYLLPAPYREEAANIYHMPIRPSDTFVVTYPRSGTTWTQELVWLIRNDLDYETAKKVPLTDRYPFLEMTTFFDEGTKKFIQEHFPDKNAVEKMITPGADLLAAAPSPRFVKTHLPLSLLPPGLLDTTKVVYVARDPRDVVVSYYHFRKSTRSAAFVGDFEMFFNLFTRDLIKYAPYFEHIKEAWEKRHHPNMLFLFYEELYKDLPGTARRVAEFFGKSYSDAELTRLSQHLHFDNFKNNKAVDLQNMKEAGIFHSDMTFVRKGKSGGWRDHFDAALAHRAARWMADNMQGTDLAFPTLSGTNN